MLLPLVVDTVMLMHGLLSSKKIRRDTPGSHPSQPDLAMIGMKRRTKGESGSVDYVGVGSDSKKKQAKINDLFKPAKRSPQEAEKPLIVSPKASTELIPLDGVHESWLPFFTQEAAKPYYKQLMTFLESEWAKGTTVFPHPCNVFSWARHCSVTSIRVVILGQDPYHDHGQAHGLAFSVQKGNKIPPSLRNIWKELYKDLGIEGKKPVHGCLEGWAKQGVLLLNTSLTVRAHQAASHSGKGWEPFTSALISYLSSTTTNIVFMLWGGHAQKRAAHIAEGRGHLVLQAAHPSPLSAHRGFFGCKHFSKANAYLKENGREPINWADCD